MIADVLKTLSEAELEAQIHKNLMNLHDGNFHVCNCACAYHKYSIIGKIDISIISVIISILC